MDFHYSESQEAIRKLAREVAIKEVAPGARERDKTGRFDYALYRRLGEVGLIGTYLPEDFGGSGADFLAWCLAMEEMGRVEASLCITLLVAVGGARHITDLATPEQKDRWRDSLLIPVARGEATLASAITEPGAGSDTAAIQTTAELKDGWWVINGTKAFSSNAGLENCQAVIVLTVSDRAKKEHSSILVPTGTPGYTIMPTYEKMGLHSSDTRELAFTDCRVPQGNLIGQRGIGRRYTVDRLFTSARIQMGSAALGLAHSCFEQTMSYARQRLAFKRPISQFQFVQGMLVEMALELELSRLLRDRAATAVDTGSPDIKLGSMVKYFCCEAARRAADHAVQIHGGLGFMDETPVSRYYRDIRAFTIADGPSEIQKWIIARAIGC